MSPGLHGELHRQASAGITRTLARSSLHGQLAHSKVSHQGHWGGSNQRAPSGVKQLCWNMERWFFFLVLTKWQPYQFHCMCQLRQEYLPGKCLFEIFFQSQNDWVRFRHAWTHLYRISPIWANINIPSSQAVAGGMETPEGPAKSYKQKCQELVGRDCPPPEPGQGPVESPGPSQFVPERAHKQMPVSVAPGTTLTYSHTFSCANKCAAQLRGKPSERRC